MNELKVKLDEGAKMPTRAHEADAGYDLYAKEGDDQVIIPGRSAVFDTGVHMQIQVGYAGVIISKSGLNVKHGITSTGLVDAMYVGSIRVKLYNNGDTTMMIRGGDKISQIVLLPIYTPELEEVDSLDETERGDNGFGSTGR